jgi:hypothetical protein
MADTIITRHAGLLKQTIEWCNSKNKSDGVPQKGGKNYLEVKFRVEGFRSYFGLEYGIETELLFADTNYVRVHALIRNGDGQVIGSGLAEERRGSNMVNKTSAVENAETSAIGRALASLGLHGGEYASANELDAVVRKSSAPPAAEPEPTPPPEPKPVNKPKTLPWNHDVPPNVFVSDHINGLSQYRSIDEMQAWASGLQDAEDFDRLERTDPIQYERLGKAFDDRCAELRNQKKGN